MISKYKRRFTGMVLGLLLVIGLFAPISASFVPESTAESSQSSNLLVGNSGGSAIEVDLLTAKAQSYEGDGGDTGAFLSYGCSWYNVACGLLMAVGNGLDRLGFWAAYLTGYGLDAVLAFSISNETYRVPFVEQGWGILRDIANLFFIGGLLIAGVSVMTGKLAGTRGGKMLVATVLVAALFVNFSLLTGKFIVQMGNFAAFAFYNKIDATVSSGYLNDFKIAGVDVKPVSVALVSKFNASQLGNQLKGKDADYGTIFFAQMFSAFIKITMAVMFIQMIILFISRVIILLLSMVIAPLAFASVAIPLFRKSEFIGFTNWLNRVFQTTFVAPVYLFFIYLIVLFINIGITDAFQNGIAASTSQSKSNGTDSFMKVLFSIVLPMMIIFGLLQMAKKTSKSMVKDFSGGITKVVGAGIGLALGAATGGAAFAARGAARVGAAGLKSGGMQKLASAAGKTRIGQGLLGKNAEARLRGKLNRMGDGLKNKTYDLRNNKDFAGALSGAGVGTVSGIGLGSMQYSKTISQSDKERNDKIDKDIENYKKAMTQDDKNARDKVKAQKATLEDDKKDAEARKKDAEGSEDMIALKKIFEDYLKQEKKDLKRQEDLFKQGVFKVGSDEYKNLQKQRSKVSGLEKTKEKKDYYNNKDFVEDAIVENELTLSDPTVAADKKEKAAENKAVLEVAKQLRKIAEHDKAIAAQDKIIAKADSVINNPNATEAQKALALDNKKDAQDIISSEQKEIDDIRATIKDSDIARHQLESSKIKALDKELKPLNAKIRDLSGNIRKTEQQIIQNEIDNYKGFWKTTAEAALSGVTQGVAAATVAGIAVASAPVGVAVGLGVAARQGYRYYRDREAAAARAEEIRVSGRS